VPGEKYSSKNTYFVVRDNKRITVGQAISRRPPVNSNNSTVVSVQESNGTIDKSKVEDESSKQTEQNSSTIKQAPIMDQETQLLEAVKNAHFFQPDFNPITMRFGSSKEERNFKNFLMGTTNTKNSNFNDKSRKSDLTNDPSELVENTNIWMNQSKTFFLSILVSVITNICLLTAYFLAFLASSQSSNFNATPSYTSSLIMMICLFVGFLIVQVVFLTLSFVSKFNRIKSFSLVHVISAILLTIMPVFILATCLPITTTSFEYAWPSKIENSVFLSSHQNIFALYSFYCFAVAILHFCSFFQLGSLFKTLIALIFLVAFSLLGFIGLTSVFNKTESEKLDTYIETLNSNGYSASISSYTINFVTTLLVKGFLSENYVILVDFALLFILIWFINRQSELIQRLSFKCDQNAQNKVTYAREQKELANWLIEVVLPAHVVDHVQEKKQYSKNHECVGVLFVSLCNFWEFFEESYEGGRELLRVLNEITVDFDRLFDDPKYKNVEKIKSIGSTFMIASGLNPEASQDESDKTHLHDLIDFALELNEKLEAFNSEAMSVCHFKFQMRMGFNFGPVTSGVIGTERLLYDIWGDTVNVASRMDSTGQAGLMQCPQAVALMLKDDYNFFKRGPIQIKGKDEMITYFLNPKENKKLNLTT
jgi:class 3 adenylate cyclase